MPHQFHSSSFELELVVRISWPFSMLQRESRETWGSPLHVRLDLSKRMCRNSLVVSKNPVSRRLRNHHLGLQEASVHLQSGSHELISAAQVHSEP